MTPRMHELSAECCITLSALAFLCKQFMLGNLLKPGTKEEGDCRKVAHAHLHLVK